ncbi:hypothetical protein K435DRAFT_857123 [Dendrothele bispora CBS 962.96]|uniref:F-box domain-containing protein n=1 Tax=Dendrothele bispora (strain CBS 962.96) TaxID=1314807 RepID=A0A4V4HGA1_DENBC|nr:hypothetical protein K435DRAFT_857123 [Dendrothele bispora CBS 962.96]
MPTDSTSNAALQPTTIMTSNRYPELQPEIVDLIIDELHGFRHDLKTCALVCRSWVSRSRFHEVKWATASVASMRPRTVAHCPYSTIPLARTNNLTIATKLFDGVQYEDKQLQHFSLFDQVLTWRSPDDGKSIADVFRHLKKLSLDGIKWWQLSQTAKSMLHLAFQTVTELWLHDVVFETGDEFLEFLSSLICLEKLCLDYVVLHAAAQSSIMQSNVFSSRFHTINLKNLSCYHSGQVIRVITPCHSLKNLSIHVVNFSDINTDCSMAIGNLLVSAGPCLEIFEFWVQAVGILEEGVDLDASLQYINFTKNPNLKNITLDVDAPAYLHPYFSALGEFRCRQCVISEIGEEWYNGRPIEGSRSWKEMESKIEELKAAMLKLADKGILQSRGTRAQAQGLTFREDESDEAQDTENDDKYRDESNEDQDKENNDEDRNDRERFSPGFGQVELQMGKVSEAARRALRPDPDVFISREQIVTTD